jgi:hypothetical protein
MWRTLIERKRVARESGRGSRRGGGGERGILGSGLFSLLWEEETVELRKGGEKSFRQFIRDSGVWGHVRICDVGE